MNPQDPKPGHSADPSRPAAGAPSSVPVDSDPVGQEETQTLSLDELGIDTPVSPHPLQPPPKAEPAAAKPAPPQPAPPPPKPVEPPQAASSAEATARLDEAMAAGLTIPGAEQIIPPERDDEPELPYSLQPTNVESEATPQVSRGTRQRKPLSGKGWICIGIVLGALLSMALYFHDWQIKRTISSPAIKSLTTLVPAEDAKPPAEWHRLGSRYFGIDQFFKPWQLDARTNAVKLASEAISKDIDWKFFTIVAEPPLEANTRLAWIENESGGKAQLVCRDYAFHDAKAPAASEGGAALAWATPLEGEIPPFPPVAASTPAGNFLIVTWGTGKMEAWIPMGAAGKGAAWSIKLAAAPIAPPTAWLDLRGPQPKGWLLAPTVKGLTVIDAATGKEMDSAEWPAPLNAKSKMAVAPIRLGSRGWGWLGSNGEFAAQWLIAPDGKPGLVWSGKLPSINLGPAGDPPRLLTFPDPDAPGGDQWVVKGDGGELIWVNNAQMPPSGNLVNVPVTQADASGPLAAIDIDGDGYEDLAGINEGGSPWRRFGPSTGEDKGRSTGLADDAAPSPPNSEIFWRLTERELVGFYVGPQSRLQQISFALPAITSSNVDPLMKDWERRREFR